MEAKSKPMFYFIFDDGHFNYMISTEDSKNPINVPKPITYPIRDASDIKKLLASPAFTVSSKGKYEPKRRPANKDIPYWMVVEKFTVTQTSTEDADVLNEEPHVFKEAPVLWYNNKKKVEEGAYVREPSLHNMNLKSPQFYIEDDLHILDRLMSKMSSEDDVFLPELRCKDYDNFSTGSFAYFDDLSESIDHPSDQVYASVGCKLCLAYMMNLEGLSLNKGKKKRNNSDVDNVYDKCQFFVPKIWNPNDPRHPSSTWDFLANGYYVTLFLCKTLLVKGKGALDLPIPLLNTIEIKANKRVRSREDVDVGFFVDPRDSSDMKIFEDYWDRKNSNQELDYKNVSFCKQPKGGEFLSMMTRSRVVDNKNFVVPKMWILLTVSEKSGKNVDVDDAVLKANAESAAYAHLFGK